VAVPRETQQDRDARAAIHSEQGLMLIYVLLLSFLIISLLRVYLLRCWRSLTSKIPEKKSQ
jgi:hypothetical protein